MHLALDEDSELLRTAIRDFTKDRVRPNSRAWDEAGAIPDAALDEAWALGVLHAGIPGAFGGAAEKNDATPSALTNAVALEELAWGDLSYALRWNAPAQVVLPIALHGSNDLKRELLPALLGEKLPAATGAWVEPSRTYDLASVTARATAAKLQGRKSFVPAGGNAAHTLVYARTGEGTGWDDMGAVLLSGSLVAGLTREGADEAIGLRAAALQRLALENAEGRPLSVDYRRLAARALTGSAAAAVGVSRAACEYAAEYAKERVAFGRPIAQYQSIAFMIADAATDVEAARWMTWKAAWRIDRGEDAIKEAGLAFRFATDAAFRIADHGVQILGGHGVIRDHLAELFFRNARTLAGTPGLFIA